MNQEEFIKKSTEEKLDAIFHSVEKTRKYFMWTLIGTLVTFVLPFIVLLIFLPQITSVYSGGLNF